MSADEKTTAQSQFDNAVESQFKNIGEIVEKGEGDDEDLGPMQVESMCMNCHENGTTRLLLIRVPYFRDIILESFECPHCHFTNNSIKAAGQIQTQGAKYTLTVESQDDMQRQLIKSDQGVLTIDSLGIEAPREGTLTNVEGAIQRIHEGLSNDQPARKEQAPELHDALQPLIDSLKSYLDGTGFPFTISLDDPTGNSWIAPNTQDRGNKYRTKLYYRTHEQNEELGIAADPDAAQAEDPDSEIVDGKEYCLPAECPGCSKPCELLIKKVNIPYFKEVYLWSNVCEHCGLRSSDVKTGGEVPELGKRITLTVKNEVDLSRDILKSDTCAVHSDELEISIQAGTLGGRFTTLEGLLTEVRDSLKGHLFDIGGGGGDSLESTEKAKWDRFFERLEWAINGDFEKFGGQFVVTLADPLANSYVQDLCAPAADPQITIEEYQRTDEEEDDLGLKDMKTEGYEEDAQEQKS
ncbi:nucleolar zinc-finger protein [Penicillium citrinum]|uniref:Nucleolar zinc-finger protein n=1 Tax=Penicillium citrinum TaxID=5077 RepID=A0A9W9NYS5_PENCI|nr:nucleolar zinc-finger protein [Penicillium citrinum]KAJ5227498.1 nucleolar zinc-finger protein [Penicillium citrinum]